VEACLGRLKKFDGGEGSVTQVLPSRGKCRQRGGGKTDNPRGVKGRVGSQTSNYIWGRKARPSARYNTFEGSKRTSRGKKSRPIFWYPQKIILARKKRSARIRLGKNGIVWVGGKKLKGKGEEALIELECLVQGKKK